MRKLLSMLTLLAALVLPGCGYNEFQTKDEQVKAAWSDVLNNYQRRADLIPNLVATVKGEANFEQETLTRVIEARARATSIQATPELVNDPEAFQKFQQAQGQLTGALSRLMVVAEQYPELRATENFQQLQAQLSETEDQIQITRRVYNDTVQTYNTLIQQFPAVLVANAFKFEPRQFFDAPKESEATPEVSFAQ